MKFLIHYAIVKLWNNNELLGSPLPQQPFEVEADSEKMAGEIATEILQKQNESCNAMFQTGVVMTYHKREIIKVSLKEEDCISSSDNV